MPRKNRRSASRSRIVALIAAASIVGLQLVAAPANASTSPAFKAKTDFPTGSNPQSVAVGDLNGDTRPDLAVANNGSDTVSILLGDSAGGFGAKNDFVTGSAPQSVAIGDFNADGKRDLAVANNGSDTVSIFLGNGSGGFGARTDFATSPSPSSVAISDLNDDGKPDLAVSTIGPPSVSILLGDGAGRFGVKTDFATGFAPESVAIGDLNADGNQDLAIANQASNTVSVLLGIGGGAFSAKTDFATGSIPRSVTVGDLNADGKPDLAVANNGASSVSVLLGDGAGNFGTKTDFTTASVPRSVAIGDLNADGKPDLAIAAGAVNSVSILLGNGAGGFGAKTDLTTGTNPYSVAIGDFNVDGKLDVVTANNGSASVSVLLGLPTTTFASALNNPVGSAPFSVAIGDLNADGKPDLAVANSGSASVSVLLGIGAGSFGAKTDFTTGSGPVSVAVGDLNADGKPDLAVANISSASVSVLLGNGAGSFGTNADFTTGSGAVSVAIGDLNADGKPDLAVANNSSASVSVLLGNGAGSFGAKTDFTTGSNPRSVAIGDLNADGKPDLAVANDGSASVSVLLGNGAGSLGAKTDFTTGSNPRTVAIGDLNADGTSDLAVANDGSTSVSVLLNAGRPTTILDPSSLNFGPRAVSSSSTPRSLTLRNGGEARLHVSDVRITGSNAANFVLAHEDCAGAAFLVGSACGIAISFAPNSAGFKTATLRITDDAPDSPQSIPLSGFGDGAAPDITITSGPMDGSSTNNNTPAWTFTSSDASATFECRLDSANFSSCASPFTATTLGDGPHAFEVRALDQAGNTSQVAHRGFTVDTSGPTVTISTGPANGSTSSDRDPAFNFASNESSATFSCKLDTGSLAACTSPYSTRQLADGSHTFIVRATDQAGNTSADASVTWTVDATGPMVTITSGPAFGSATNDNTPTFAFSSEAGATFQCKVDAQNWRACSDPASDTPVSALANGSHVFNVRATDAAGNVGDPLDVQFSVDTKAPKPQITSGPADGSTVKTKVPATITFAFTSNEDADFTCQLDTSGFTSCDSPQTYTGVAAGSHTFSLRATDAAGNAQTISRTFTIKKKKR